MCLATRFSIGGSRKPTTFASSPRGCDTQAAIRRHDLSRQFVETLRGLCRRPRLLRWSLSLPRCLSTAVLSNIGDPARRFSARVRRENRHVWAGEMKLERFYGAPPVRPKTSLAIGVTNYAGVLALAAAFDSLVLAAVDVERILENMVEECLKSAELPARSKH